MKKLENPNKRIMMTARMPKDVVKELNRIAKLNGTDRTSEIERYLREGIKRTKKILDMKFSSFCIMVLTLSAVGLYVWMTFWV